MKLLIQLLFLCCFTFTTNAQEQYIDQDYKITLKAFGQNALLSIEPEPGVKFYWRHPGEMGLATKFLFNQEVKVYWPIPELDKTSYIYHDKTEFVLQPVRFADSLTMQINFTTCRDTCENHDLTFTTKLTDKQEAAEIIEALANTPYPNGSENLKITSVTQELIDQQHWLKIKFVNDNEIKTPKIFLDLPEYVYFDPTKFDLSIEADGQVLSMPFKLLNQHNLIDKIYLNLVADNGHAVEYEETQVTTIAYSWIWIMIYAILGGLILNIMPCVLPILALKALQLIKISGKEHQLIRKSFIAQAVGIITSFIVIAVMTYIFQQIGRQVGFGLQFQQPLYLITMIIILSLIAISLVANIELKLQVPAFITKYFINDRADILGFFSSGILVTMLAIPCTAPFITIAVGFALTANFLQMLVIFMLMGIGMAIPYLVLACFPKIGQIFPKPGSWMQNCRKLLGIIIFATGIWLIYIISTQLGNKAAIILFLLIILLKFVLLDTSIFQQKLKLLLILILISLCYALPYQLYEEKYKEELLIEDVWKEYRPEQIEAFINKGHIVLVDITASWCTTCQINKLMTLNNDRILNLMKTRDIIGMRADVSAGNSEQVSQLMKHHHHYGIPLNILYSKKHPQGLVLKTFLLPGDLIDAIQRAN